jgi:hypothetical protein
MAAHMNTKVLAISLTKVEAMTTTMMMVEMTSAKNMVLQGQ